MGQQNRSFAQASVCRRSRSNVWQPVASTDGDRIRGQRNVSSTSSSRRKHEQHEQTKSSLEVPRLRMQEFLSFKQSFLRESQFQLTTCEKLWQQGVEVPSAWPSWGEQNALLSDAMALAVWRRELLKGSQTPLHK